MAQRDHVAGALGGLDGGHPCDGEHVALVDLAIGDGGRGGRAACSTLHAGHGAAVGGVLRRDIDHAGTAQRIEVCEGQVTHGCHSFDINRTGRHRPARSSGPSPATTGALHSAAIRTYSGAPRVPLVIRDPCRIGARTWRSRSRSSRSRAVGLKHRRHRLRQLPQQPARRARAALPRLHARHRVPDGAVHPRAAADAGVEGPAVHCVPDAVELRGVLARTGARPGARDARPACTRPAADGDAHLQQALPVLEPGDLLDARARACASSLPYT